MLRGNIAATSLKMLLKNLYSVQCYDKLNMNVLTLSLRENFCWGLIYFDQFICFGLEKRNIIYWYALLHVTKCLFDIFTCV